MEAPPAYLDASQWVFWGLTIAVAFLGGRARSASRRASCAFEHAAQIPEVLKTMRALLKSHQRGLIYKKHIARMLVIVATQPDNTGGLIHREQSALLEELEELRP